MKGISSTLIIIVTAIVILIAALVVLTIFSGGMGPIVDWSSKQNICMTEYSSICAATNSEPVAWDAKAKTYVPMLGVYKMCSCSNLVINCKCENRIATGCKPIPIEQAGCASA